jgi:hypothetical protein
MQEEGASGQAGESLGRCWCKSDQSLTNIMRLLLPTIPSQAVQMPMHLSTGLEHVT